jgi:hypothetical protein
MVIMFPAAEFFMIWKSPLVLDKFDITLGVQWLRSLGPIFWDFSKLAMSFWWCDHQATLHGDISSTARPNLATCDGQELLPCLLEEFGTLFVEPRGLPPSGHCDHQIHLLAGSGPVVVRPYRYPTV